MNIEQLECLTFEDSLLVSPEDFVSFGVVAGRDEEISFESIGRFSSFDENVSIVVNVVVDSMGINVDSSFDVSTFDSTLIWLGESFGTSSTIIGIERIDVTG